MILTLKIQSNIYSRETGGFKVNKFCFIIKRKFVLYYVAGRTKPSTPPYINVVVPVINSNYKSDKTLDKIGIGPGLIKLSNLYYCDPSMVYKIKVMNQLSNRSNQSLNQD